MSYRNIWIISANDSGKILFSRHYPTVEIRAKAFLKEEYIPVCSNTEFAASLHQELRINETGKQFSSLRDTCKRINQKPVHEVMTSAGSLWPVLVVAQNSLLFCCLPLVDKDVTKSIIQHPSISLGFSLLLGMVDILGLLPSKESEITKRLIDLAQFLRNVMPLGTPSDTKGISPLTSNHLSLMKEKLPAWRPQLFQGKPSFQILITEYIRCFQYNSEDHKDHWDIFGRITCHAELEGACPMVTLALTHSEQGLDLTLDSLLTHPCVQTTDVEALAIPSASLIGSRKIRFTPPLETFTLCHYVIEKQEFFDFPLQGFYKVRNESQTQFLLQLKLSEKIKNSFEYFQVELPFYKRGIIKSYDCKPTTGHTSLSADKKKLIWNIGSKFPSKHLEISLNGSLKFELCPEKDTDALVTSTAYAEIKFKILEYTYSGVCIEPKSIQVTPGTKSKPVSVREFISKDYRIWNSYVET